MEGRDERDRPTRADTRRGGPWIGLAAAAMLWLAGCATSLRGTPPPPEPGATTSLTRAPVAATELEASDLATWCACHRHRKSVRLGAVAVATVFAYGGLQWGYGNGSFGFVDEGWFEEDSAYGGADKVGHAFSAHAGTAAAAAILRKWGFSHQESARRGAVLSFITLAAIELADGTSERHGFSTSDLLADGVGCLFGYLHETSPWVHRVLDFRWEWFPNEPVSGGADLTTDYENGTYLLAANIGALRHRGASWLDFVDLQVGYRTRGYAYEDQDNERWAFVGVGLNVANVLRRLGVRWAAVFDYFQVPFVSIRLGYEFGEGRTEVLWGP